MPDQEKNLPTVDVREDDLLALSADVLNTLLRDHTTGRNIFWATHDYEASGPEYDYHAQILPHLITGEHGMVIRPRVLKTKAEQTDRSKDMAEVFTPAWVVKKMVDYVDIDIHSRTLELTCGEAPFLVSRYDATTGEPIGLDERVGMLDRKLRLVTGQQLSDEEWLAQVRQAFESTYGYEWQGDSLLLARENLLYTFVDYYTARFGHHPDTTLLQAFAGIISWNLWQMDGLTYRIPREKKEETKMQLSFFDEAPVQALPPFCLIMDWKKGKKIKVNDIKRKITKNQDIMKFDVIIGNPPYQQEAKGANESDTPLYHFFFDESFKIGNVVELISPARFLFNAGGTPRGWNNKMLNDEHLKVLYYEQDSSKIFSNTDIKGGVVITYHDSDKAFGAIKTFTSFPELNTILKKVQFKTKESITQIVTNRGIYRYSDKAYKEEPEEMMKTADRRIAPSCFERMPRLFAKEKPIDHHGYIQVFGIQDGERIYRWFREDYIVPVDNLNQYKVLVAKASGSGLFGEPLSPPVICNPSVAFTETFISVGASDSLKEVQAIEKYIKTKFVRTMLGILKVTQNNAKPTWAYVPLQDFTSSSDIDWSKSIAEIDEQLFDKYGLDEQERNFIRTKVKEMA